MYNKQRVFPSVYFIPYKNLIYDIIKYFMNMNKTKSDYFDRIVRGIERSKFKKDLKEEEERRKRAKRRTDFGSVLGELDLPEHDFSSNDSIKFTIEGSIATIDTVTVEGVKRNGKKVNFRKNEGKKDLDTDKLIAEYNRKTEQFMSNIVKDKHGSRCYFIEAKSKDGNCIKGSILIKLK